MDFLNLQSIDDNCHMNIFLRQRVCFTHGVGNKLYDTNGKEYTDFFGGIAVNCLGYNYPPLVDAVCAQAKKVMHLSNLFYNEPQATLAASLIKNSPFDRVAFGNSGAEAVELALKLARKYFYERGEKKYKVVCMQDSFHGRTLATLTATGQEKYQKPYAPLPSGFLHVPFNDFDALQAAVCGDDEVGAVLIECVQGESGVRPTSQAFMTAVSALCQDKNILLILDEVQTGMGRTGKLFGFLHYGIVPDIVAIAKGLGGGVPIGAVLATERVASALKVGDHGSTFGGNPLACAAANVVVDTLTKTDMLNTVAETGAYFLQRLGELSHHKSVREVRGLGLLIGVELDASVKNTAILESMLANGFVIGVAGNNTLRFAPPFTITKPEIDALIAALNAVL